MTGERKTMELDRFRALMDAYGAVSERWPEEERSGAVALLAISGEATALRREAERLDAALDLVPEVAPSQALMARILSECEEPRPAARARWIDTLVEAIWPDGRIWQPLGAFATAAVLGLVLGFSQIGIGSVSTDDAFAGVDLDAFAFAAVDDGDLSL